MRHSEVFKVNRFASIESIMNRISEFSVNKRIISIVSNDSFLSSTVTVVVEELPVKNTRPAIRKQRVYGKSQYRGVSWNNRLKRWRVQFRYQGINHSAGSYLHETDAAKAYDKLVVSVVGPGDYLNFPDDYKEAN